MEILLALRKETGLTQNDIAAHLGISRQAYANYETGKREPDLKTLVNIANFFGVTVGYLLGEEEKPTANDGELSDNRKKLMEFANSVPEDKVDLLLRVMQSIVEADQ